MSILKYNKYVDGVAESHHDDHELHGKDKNCIWSREELHRQAIIQVVFGEFSWDDKGSSKKDFRIKSNMEDMYFFCCCCGRYVLPLYSIYILVNI